MKNIDKLGVFYLGQHHADDDDWAGERTPLLYDAKDLTTHAMCVGMTGSGKTGLCISLLEEAALDGIPAIAIDPKGDLGNLLLTFPELRGSDFRPWIDEDAARRKEMSPDDFAEAQARLWREGLEGSGQSGERIRELRDRADLAIYTPGSQAGLPISVLSSFGAPPPQIRADADLLQERVTSTTSGLLTLMGIDADPIQSREHILVSTLLHELWAEGRDLDLAGLIQAIQSPPFERVGVLDLESFYPGKDRFKLAMRLNNLLASPGFRSWLVGQPLDVQQLLYTPEGKPRIAIVSIAHLSESERMFFVSLLLNQVLGWMRTKPGTNSLRALLYMDEIFGFVPPTAEPPSKKPLLTLLKQARAYGLGVVLATQNPVDLDYKGLSNTGTWFLGRLQTERDKRRVLEGLEGAAGGARFDKQAMERTLAGLGKRVFLMHNVHDDGPVVFRTRWAMSYLRGPLTRDQIKRLMADAPTPVAAPAADAVAPNAAVQSTRPVLPPGVPQVALPLRAGDKDDVRYDAQLVGMGRIQYVDRKTKRLKHSEEVALLLPLSDRGIDWTTASEIDLCREELEPEPEDGAGFSELPAEAGKARSYTSWRKQFADTLYRTRACELHRSPELGLVSEPGESEGDFRVRLADMARERRDGLADKLRAKYAKRAARLEERMRRAQQKIEKEQEQHSEKKMQTAISLGTTLLSAFLGRKKLSYGTLGRATTTVRGAGRAAREKRDVLRAQEDLAEIERQLAELNRELEDELDQLEDRFDATSEELETVALRPRRSDIEVRLVSLAWAPFGRADDGSLQPLWS